MGTSTTESVSSHPAAPASSLQASWLAAVPGHPEWTLRTESMPRPTPPRLREPQVETWRVPVQGAVNWYQTSRLWVEAPQDSAPSAVARASEKEPWNPNPLTTASACSQLSWLGRRAEL